PPVRWEVVETNREARAGSAIMKRVMGKMGRKPDGPRMNMTVYLPAKAAGPVPVLLAITFGMGTGRRGPAGGFDTIGEVLGRGWGYASLVYTDIQPDQANRWKEGVIGLGLNAGQTRPDPDGWGTISAWAWGISRAIDYFETDPAV